MKGTTLEMCILGPLEVRGSSGAAVLTARRQQVVLAMLLGKVNQVTPVDILVDAVWGEEPPATARRQVRICVSTIRKRLTRCGLSTVVKTCPQGYRAVLAPHQLDLTVFQQRVAEARELAARRRLEEAAPRFAQALRLWRGQPFLGIDSDRVSTIATQLTDLRLGIVEEYASLLLELGRPTLVVAELLGLVEEHPFRERMRAHLMIALYRSGRRADALREYRLAREIFARELGLDPGRDLRDLERGILADDLTFATPLAEMEYA